MTSRKWNTFFSIVSLACFGLCCEPAEKKNNAKASFSPPVAEKRPHELRTNGNIRIDNYYWMRLTDEQKNASQKDEQTQKVLAYLEAENDYLSGKLAHTKGLQEKIYSEIVSRIKDTDESVPYLDNGYWYYSRYEKGQEYPIYCRKKISLEAPEEILLDVNVLAKGHSFYSVNDLSVSEDNNLLAYAVDTISRRRYTIFVKDLRSGRIIDTSIPNTEGKVTWANDSKTFFYSVKDSATLRSRWIVKHRIGEDLTNDKIVYEEKDETFITGIVKTKSRKFLMIWSSSTLTDDYQILDANTPDKPFVNFTKREPGLEYAIDHYKDRFYVLTNFDAPNFRLMETSDTGTAKMNWKEKIAHRKDTLLEDIDIFKNHLVVSETANANSLLRIFDQNTGASHYVKMDEGAYTIYPSVNEELNTEKLRYNYTSLTTPTSTYEYDMRTRENTLLKQTEVVGGYDKSNYKTERIWATAKDGTKIPMSVVYRKGLKRDGNNPALIYGYGSYGFSSDPKFGLSRLSLLDRGFVFAMAHIRGGEEMGRQWYEDGKMFKKKNTFTDFIACSEHLIAQRYTSSQNLFAMGGSAGGLLMGAIVNMRPDLYKGVIANVPFVDVVTTMLDETIPLTTGEFDEWGNPKTAESYNYMLSYSPYDQVKVQNYPNMLVTTGLHDSQVQYWEPAKWVAKLRELKTDNNTLLLRTNMETGHGGTTGRFRSYKELAQGTVIPNNINPYFFANFMLPKRELQVTEYTEVYLV